MRRTLSPRRAALAGLVLPALMFAASGSAEAAGFGRTVTRTTLGQPLDFVAHLTVGPDEDLERHCVSATVLAGDHPVAPAQVRARIEGLGSAQPRVRVTTDGPMDEPVVTVEVSVGCGSRMARRFVAFVDPPGLALAHAEPAEPMPAPERAADARSASLGDFARRIESGAPRGAPTDTPTSGGARAEGDGPRETRRAADRPVRAATRPVTPRTVATPRRAADTPEARESRRHRAVPRSTPPRGGPRLQLDAPVLLATRPGAASAPASAVAAAAVAAAAIPAAQAAASAPAPVSATAPDALQVARMQALEAGLAGLRRDQQAQQQTIATLQGQLREAEAARYANPLVYALVGLLVLMGAALVAVWRMRPQQRERAAWFDAQVSRLQREAAEGAREDEEAQALHAQALAQRVRSTAAPVPSSLSGSLGLNPIEPPESWRTRSGTLLRTTAPESIGGLEVTTVLAPSMRLDAPPLDVSGQVVEEPGEPSMEELIDLEQQAEFFVVLGQDEAAIALLDQYIRSSRGQSPLPWLQLLELHQRRADRNAYERVRERYDERFDALAPEWTDDVGRGRGLEAYPQTVARLQALWSTPLSAMHVLDALLFRRAATEEAFDFPAYRDLLFLYSVARELAVQVETDFGAIDLFLPLEDAPAPAGPSSHLVDFDVEAAPTRPLDVDVSRWDVDVPDLDVDDAREPDEDGDASPSRPLRLVR